MNIKTISVLKQNLTTPQGIICALLASLSFLTAFSIRGTRWQFFLKPITKDLFNIYIDAVARNRFRLNYIKLRDIFKLVLELLSKRD